VAERSTAYVYVRSIAGIAGSKPAQSMDVHLFCLLRGSSQSCEKQLLESSCLFVRLPAWNNSAPLEGLPWNMTFNIFRKYVHIIQDLLKSDKNVVYFNKYLCSFFIISRWMLFRIRNVSNKSCKEYRSTFLIQQLFPESWPFMR
jgi:hypothetical protein